VKVITSLVVGSAGDISNSTVGSATGRITSSCEEIVFTPSVVTIKAKKPNFIKFRIEPHVSNNLT
jgi:hypothetical protein